MLMVKVYLNLNLNPLMTWYVSVATKFSPYLTLHSIIFVINLMIFSCFAYNLIHKITLYTIKTSEWSLSVGKKQKKKKHFCTYFVVSKYYMDEIAGIYHCGATKKKKRAS